MKLEPSLLLRRSLLILFATTFVQTAEAQPPAFMSEEEARQRQLQYEQQWKDADNTEDKVRYGLEVAKLLARDDFGAAESFAEQAIELALKDGDALILSRAYLQFGMMYLKANRQSDALATFKTGLKYALRVDKNPASVSLHHNLGNIYGQMGNFEKAVEHNLHAVEIIEQFPQNPRRDKQLSIILNSLSDILAQNGQYSRAIAFSQKSIVLSTGIEEWNIVAGTWMNIGNYSQKMGDVIASEQAFKKATEYRELSQKKRAQRGSPQSRGN